MSRGSVVKWPIGYESKFIPNVFIDIYKQQIQDWALQPWTPATETIDLGGVDLIRKQWNGKIHIMPARRIDEWMLEEWV